MNEKTTIPAYNSPEYDAFLEKFKARHTSDDCFTPGNVYGAVVNWVMSRYGIDTGDIVRPFWPGANYETRDYPEGCTVVDNPPFSLCAKIVKFYLDRGVRFFLFCPGLSALGIIRDKRASVIVTGSTITYDNGATINTNFVTNLAGDVLIETASDLHDSINAANEENLRKVKKQIRHFKHPLGTITAAGANFLAVHHAPLRIMRHEAQFIRKLDCGTELFGGGLLLSDRATSRRKHAERRARKNAAKEEAAKYTQLTLSGRERKQQREMR